MIYAIFAYAAALIVANLSVAHFGPVVAPLNAFLLIGLDLSLRDWLHMRLRWWQMLALIVCSGALTYVLNPAAGLVAVASVTAFAAAALVDWGVFAALFKRRPWLVASNYSNGASALVDTLVFLAIAPFPWSWVIALTMFVAKMAGGAAWAYAIHKMTLRAQRA